ncbi:radical SAM protein [Schwartzia succinivorans]|jgi:radical SAM protein with 4Fe4S-binding SPASM domain|uniref:Radical SAM additional 4Fe4S-binding SPASM domain-containing protein n=1 Tax=Schwartzia succinivorans DSM 10502 TaxID=1123243 RepID=A0A1M4XPM6_9FIRM|nr:radical SAM/SPASM domain-containing protein [Schwartzia succinivorans]SHE95398.1 radical SAM additional 4Fe4S-binding SPASM domain-containing protein [Schwartzia succinivorans DSM 10502]
MGIIKESFDTNRQILGKILPLDTPFTVIVDASEVCNLKCNYCFRSDRNKDNWGYAKALNKMEWNTFVKIINQIKEFPQSVKQISLSCHGEPLTNSNLAKMVSHIKSEGIKSRVSIHTNATLLTETYARELAQSGIDRIVVSLQGLNSEAYERICGVKIDYNKFYNNLKLLYGYKGEKTQIYIKIANTALCEGEEQEFYDMFTPIADRVFIEQIVPIWKNVDSVGVNMDIQNKYGKKFKKQKCCPLIFHTVVVLPNGDVYPCTQLLSEEKLGNINDNSLLHYWQSDRRQELLKQQLELRSPQMCEDCSILNNSIYSEADMIDEYRFEILGRMKTK